jgi:AraC family transcriptional regulator
LAELLTTREGAVAMPERSRQISRPGTAALHREAVERAIITMHERLDEPLSLDALASAAILSRYHFSRVFHQLTGLPPGRFLATLRLAEAKRLLLTTPLSVTDICFRVGYNSLGTFTMRFTQSVSVSPGRFRQLCRAGLPLTVLPQESAGQEASTGGVVTGKVEVPAGAPGPIFIGLFATPVPEGRPCRCALLASPGEYRINDVPGGSYQVLAISFPWPDEPLAMLLPPNGCLRVGSARHPVRLGSGQRVGRADLRLRPAALTDPPMLVALPMLLAERAEWEASRA